MHVPPASYRTTYLALRNSTASHTTCRMVVFVACLDVDALCASKIFAGILKRDLIPHRICPVTGYAELKATYGDLEADVTTVVLIGCGALIDLEDYLTSNEGVESDEINESDGREKQVRRKIYVFDSHRPWNLQNVFGTNEVVCFDDGDVDDGLLDKERDAYIKIMMLLGEEEESDTGSSSDSDADRDNDDDDDDDDKLEDHYIDDDAVQDTENFDDDKSEQTNTISSFGKRKSPSSSRSPSPIPQRQKSAKHQLRRECQETVRLYYARGTSYSTPVASQMYTLLSFLGEASNSSLWLSIVGTTAVDKVSPQLYRRLFPLLRDEVKRLNPSASSQLSADDSTLIVQPDYRLFLMRHWSLYDSMIHSSYVTSRLLLWTDDGLKRLHKMLARMGIALQLAREKWTHVDVSLKRELKDRLSGVAEVYGIGNVVRTGVVRKFGYRGIVSAGDAVEGIAALLECGKGHSVVENKENIVKGISAGTTKQDLDWNAVKENWIENFWTSWDALDNIDLLLHGLQRAKILQEAVVRTSTALLEKNQVHILRSFRLSVLKDGPDLELFTNPLTLVRLACWINECKSEQDGRQIPMVMAALDRDRDTYTVVGLPASVLMRKKGGKVVNEDSDDEDEDEEEEEETARNSFGLVFQEVAGETHARVKIDSFESSVIEVRKDDLTSFLEGMTLASIR
ncbi:CDC45 family [Lipomyces oligophaga]|uniref:CDC45 family n=1 Tax=Lipomyces oligophaga TaxID=45792 RepID=UPI0034CDD0BA